jgi:diadenosine tetraphosphate (Ap4A) HIT family hydrolase
MSINDSPRTHCPLCSPTSPSALLWADDQCRIIRVQEPEAAAFPGYCRVIWNDHVTELSLLSRAQRHHLIDIVCAVETVLREQLKPHKINLASLGNSVAHLHWHIIPRWRDDTHFPLSIWSAAQRAMARSYPILSDEILSLALHSHISPLHIG